MANQTAHQTGSPAGTGGMSAQNNLSLPDGGNMIGYVEPIVGAVARREVGGYFGFPLIRAGETITPEIFARAQNMGRLFELIASTDSE